MMKSKKHAFKILTGAIAVALMAGGAALAQIASPVPGDPIKIDSGLVAGKILPSGIRAYLGIPYAAPPVEELRWREPQPVKPWEGVFNADRVGPACIQNLARHDSLNYAGTPATSEDCLTVNVWTPPGTQAGAKLPVFVWVYGGGFVVGSNGRAFDGGEGLAKKGLVYVSLNWRNGTLGFFSHPELTAESPHKASGNQGLLDQVAALQWVRRNIAQFGGDPDNVTISGHSAGSTSLGYLQVSPLAHGLIHKIVGMSGAPFFKGTPFDHLDLKTAEAVGVKIQEAAGAKSLADLRNVPADKIIALPRVPGQKRYPVIDGYLITDTPDNLFAAGKQNDVPVMIGGTRDEVQVSIWDIKTLAEYKALASKLYGDQADKFLRAYPAKTDAEAQRAAMEAGRDNSFSGWVRNWANHQLASGHSDTYVYRFSRVPQYTPGYVPESPFNTVYHGADVAYWLNTLDALNLFHNVRVFTEVDRKLSNDMSDAIVAFARTGNPNTKSFVWPKYTAGSKKLLEIGDKVQSEAWPNEERMAVFETLPGN
jgi:para-nitrobenzyl esterase